MHVDQRFFWGNNAEAGAELEPALTSLQGTRLSQTRLPRQQEGGASYRPLP